MMVRWLRDKKIFPDASVDLVYLDPPFNSNAGSKCLILAGLGCPKILQKTSCTEPDI
jgi:16S rRNA G966 N2-methylase RsmD